MVNSLVHNQPHFTLLNVKAEGSDTKVLNRLCRKGAMKEY